MMDFLSFNEFQHYVTASYVASIIAITGLSAYILTVSKQQKTRLKALEKKIEK